MKIPSYPVRLLLQLFCLLGIMSCQTREPAADIPVTNNHGKPEAASTSDMKSMEKSKQKM